MGRRRGIGGVQMTLAEGGQRLAAKGIAEEIIRLHGRFGEKTIHAGPCNREPIRLPAIGEEEG